MNMIVSTAAFTGAAAIPMLASEPDPIFAKIEAYKRALANRDQASGEWGSLSTSDHEAYGAAEDKFRDASDALEEAESNLLTTVPTTADGVAAVLPLAACILLGSASDEGIFEPIADGDRLAVGVNFLPMIADAIARLNSAA